MEAVINTRIKKFVTLHNVLHDFFAHMGMGEAIMELNIAQEFVSVDQDLLFLVILDPIKLYDNLDHGQLLKNLEGYKVGPKMRGIMEEFLA